jgi:hypothetical protein
MQAVKEICTNSLRIRRKFMGSEPDMRARFSIGICIIISK